jgi:hypothetical protein
MKAFPSTPIAYASYPYKCIINLNEPFIAIIQFETGSAWGRGVWDVTKRFNNEKHMDNWVNLMCRKKGWTLDETYLLYNQ